MRVLVTGGAGFIGANLSRRLIGDGHAVVVLDNLSSGFRSNLSGLHLDLRVADILDLDALRAATKGVDTIVHLAAQGSVPRSIEDPWLTHAVNVDGTMNVLLAARREGAHIIYSSSSSVYGADQALPKRETMHARPQSPYAVSKLSSESYVLAFQHVYGIPALVFRFFNVYGPLQSAGHAYAAVVPAFLEALLADKPLTVYGDGQQSRDFTSVDTIVGVLAEAVNRRVRSDDAVNLAFGSRTSLLELIALLEQVSSRRAVVTHVPERPGDVRASQADNTRLLALFPDAAPQDLCVGLRTTLDWFQTARRQQ
ncbi:MAG: NAD-dependent epimerase/dehydratase family protein [Nakamurella sp.]